MTRLLGWLRAVPVAVYLYGLLAVGLIAGYQGWAYHQRQLGAERVLTAQAVHVRDSLAKALKAKDGQFRRDTLRIVRSIETIDTLIQHRVDTALVHQTDTVKITVSEAKAVQDTLRSCRSVLRDCADIQRDLRGMLKADSAIIRSLQRQTGLRARLLARCGLTAGYGGVQAGGTLRAGPAVILGCRVVP